jgi:hypothetical protein
MGHNAKTSLRANVFRSSPNNGHGPAQSGRQKSAKNRRSLSVQISARQKSEDDRAANGVSGHADAVVIVGGDVSLVT